MRKFNFLVGALGGLFGGMLMSNKKLRHKLQKTDDPKEAAKMIGKEVQRSGKEVAHEAKDWLESPEVQKGWKKAKKYMTKKLGEASKEAQKQTKTAYKKAKKAMTK